MELHKEGKTIREIASEVYMSQSRIISIIKKTEAKEAKEELRKQEEGKESVMQAKYRKVLCLFREGKHPGDVAIESGMTADDVIKAYIDFQKLDGIFEFARAYREHRDYGAALLVLTTTLRDQGLDVEDAIHVIKRATERLRRLKRTTFNR